MRTIRQGTFETNSSSMHAIVISRSPSIQEKSQILFDLKKDFSQRRLFLRNSVDDKASYIFHILVSNIQLPYHYGTPFTEEEEDRVNVLFKRFTKYFDLVRQYIFREYKCEAIFNYRLNMDKDKGVAYIDSDDNVFAGSGCYGHKTFINIIRLDKVILDLLAFLKGVSLIPEDIDYSWWTVMDFILDENSTIIQNTDECSEEDEQGQLDYIKEYLEKSNYNCYIDWPLGG